MADFAKEIIDVNIEKELKQSYLDYAMSVIVGRALPDVRDGLKPVHRRVLFAMKILGNDWNKAYKKSARVVGDVIGKYHPHGESAVYDTLVRMAQDFSLRYMLIDGQGNFGSIDGDPPAAMRYTEVRMAKISHMLLADLDKETVDFVPNYDETEMQPSVLPNRVPNLLVNGGSGIAVGMATNIPPHNLNEVIDATLALIDNSSLTITDLMEHIPGPDFPTSAIINGKAGIVQAYKTGRGKIYIRSKTHIEQDKNSKKQSIIITELPYQVNKANLIEKIAELVKEKKIEGISALRDESDKDGIRVVIEVKKQDSPDVLLNNLYAQTQLQSVFGINIVALVDNQPKVLNLKQLLECFIEHRQEVVSRRTSYELRKARDRAHILEGLGVALSNIDEVIALIKAAADSKAAKIKLLSRCWPSNMVKSMLDDADSDLCRPEDLPTEYGFMSNGYQLSPNQAQAILDLKLHRLTGLEQDKIIHEFKDIINKIKDFIAILSDKNLLMDVIKKELIEIKEEFGDKRRTEILTAHEDFSIEDLITEEDMVVTLSRTGYIKSQPVSSYQAQRRGGRGKSATQMKDEDVIYKMFVANTHDTLLCFSTAGKVYWLKVYELPVASRSSKGKPIVNLLPFSKDESLSSVLSVRDYLDSHYIFMATCLGTVKKVALKDFSRPRANGIIALNLNENDSLVGADIVTDEHDVVLCIDSGKAIRFKADTIRCMGRTAIGVRGVKLKDSKVNSLIVTKGAGKLIIATENGFGKRTELSEFSVIKRGGQGVIAIQASERNGKVISALEVDDNDEIFLISDKGTMVRTKVSGISIVGRNTQGVKLINLQSDEKLVAMQKIQEDEDKEDEEGEEIVDTQTDS